MPTVDRRRKYKCSDCGQDCRVEPVEMMLHRKHYLYGYWLWLSATLCPICRVARYDWWAELAHKQSSKSA